MLEYTKAGDGARLAMLVLHDDARTAAVYGRRVAIVEKTGLIGGAGINTGTIPSKTLREAALALSGWRSRRLFGVDLSLRRDATISDSSFAHRSKAAASKIAGMNRALLKWR